MTNEIQHKTLQEILIEAMEFKGLTIPKLAQLTNIPERYLFAFRDNDLKKLPPAPYIRGYLMKIAEVLNIEGGALWEIYKRQNPVKTSGINDRLPANRFVIKSMNKKFIILGIVVILVIIYGIWEGSGYIGTPSIQITNPVENNSTSNLPYIKLAGKIDPQDKLTINEEEISSLDNGRFEKEFPLQSGVNTVEFKVKRFLGKEIKIVKQIIYQP
ncbi:helix-turn-helix domain-containing protein [Candidatus Wolfebacteria bacterium]|nr:helix-turn-helix domain-containing protein [Candidatus Wolfebacteria bacterium]